MTKKCGKKCEVYSRVVGYYRPIMNWNKGKKEEFKDRVAFDENKSTGHDFNDNDY
jgi:ribonucleoside-triphosphate reductase (formate)